MEGITDADYQHAKRVCKELETKLGEYHDFYVKSDTLLLADDFKNFRKICLKIYLDPVKFISAPGSGAEVKLELLTDVDMLLMVEKGIRGGICHAIHIHSIMIFNILKNCPTFIMIYHFYGKE